METQTTTKEVNVEEVAGFKLLKEREKYQFGTIGNKSLFSNLKDLDYVGLQAFSDAVDRLPVAEEAHIQAVDEQGDFERFKTIRNAETKDPFSVVSDKYALIQYPDMFHPILEACQQNDLHIAGLLSTSENGGRVEGRCVIGNPEATIQVLNDTGDYILMGFRMQASHDGSGAVKITPFGVRVVCCNDNTWGNWLPHMSVKHIGEPLKRVGDVSKFISEYLEMVPTIKEKIDLAAQTKVNREEFILAVLGANIPVRTVANWAQDMEVFEPQIKENGLTLWTGYNSFTAYYTHSEKVQKRAQGNRDHFTNVATDLLDPESFNHLVEKGKEKANELRNKRQAQLAGEGRLTVPVIAGIIDDAE